MLPKLKITFERWKWNKEHEIYVSTEGRIKDRYKQEVPIVLNQGGYPSFYSEPAAKIVLLHRVVLNTWRPREDANELTVEHKDQNKRNTSLSNLMWMTEAENQRRSKNNLIGGKKKEKAIKTIRANGVTMTIEEAVTFIYALPSTSAQYSKVQVREKVEEMLKSNKQKKAIFGVTLEEIK